ncbi:MAG: hypothetical protein V2A73_16470, partial [Pseudomonadota bacterium]
MIDWKNNERQWLQWATIGLATIILLPLLGSYGLWDPQEITIADSAREMARRGDWGSVLGTRPPLT